MNKENRKLLKDTRLEYLKKKYPKNPEWGFGDKKYEDKTANGLTKCIVEFLNHSGWQAERISNMGRWVVDKHHIKGGYYIKGSGTNGTADISATIYGRSVKIEVKIGKDVQSDAQKKYQKEIENAGGVYIIVKNFDDFIEWYNKILIFVKK